MPNVRVKALVHQYENKSKVTQLARGQTSTQIQV